jgi:hypothetical protein
MHRFTRVALLGFVVSAGGAACGGTDPGHGLGTTETEGGAFDGAVLEGGVSDGGVETSATGDSGSKHDASDAEDSGSAHPQDAASDVIVVGSDAGFVTAAHPAWPQLPSNGGIVLNPMKLVVVATSGDPQAADFFAFGDALIASQWYQTIGKDYDLGTPSASVHVTGPAITTDPNSAAMEAYIASAVAGVPDAAADGETMYMLFLPTGIDILDDTTNMPNTGCQYYGGYHYTYDESGDAWGVIQHCPLTGINLTDLQWMTIGASHEIAEGATDPIPGNGYTLVANIDQQQPWTQSPYVAALYGEVGDMCVDTQVTEGSYTYQRMWSNTAAEGTGDPCVPAYSSYAYVNASAPQGWYTITAGGSVDITLTGFSDRATADWVVDSAVWTSSDDGYTATVSSPTVYMGSSGTYPTTNNGKTSTLTVTAPSAAEGSWATVAIYSEPLTFSGDPYHLWVVGVYIP